MPWYALQTHTAFESRVADRLALDRVETYWPSYERKVRHARKERTVRRSLFPGYLFAQFEDRYLIVPTPHVVRLVGIGDRPVAIPDAEIASIRLMAESPTVKPVPWLKSGEPVRIIRGPLAGVEGVILHAKGKEKTRVVVSVAMLARSISAEVDVDSIEALREVA